MGSFSLGSMFDSVKPWRATPFRSRRVQMEQLRTPLLALSDVIAVFIQGGPCAAEQVSFFTTNLFLLILASVSQFPCYSSPPILPRYCIPSSSPLLTPLPIDSYTSFSRTPTSLLPYPLTSYPTHCVLLPFCSTVFHAVSLQK
jgi:hypothetical protein